MIFWILRVGKSRTDFFWNFLSSCWVFFVVILGGGVQLTALYSSCITDDDHGVQVKGRVGVWEVYCACEF